MQHIRGETQISELMVLRNREAEPMEDASHTLDSTTSTMLLCWQSLASGLPLEKFCYG
jgi:hypothetical protein